MRIIFRGLFLASIFAFLLGQAGLVHAADPQEKLKQLLNQSRRPTMAEVMGLFPDGLPDDATIGQWLGTKVALGDGQQLGRGLSQLVAELETAFPDARYATLGRDAVYAADLLEAYYLALGQTDRVKRIHVSTPAISASSAELGRMLFTVGLDADPQGRRFVLLDRTSYRTGGSQSYIVMSAAVDILKKKKMTKRQIAEKLGVGSSQQGMEVKKNMRRQSPKTAEDYPMPPLVHIATLASYVDKLVWHNTYGLPLVKYNNGEIGGTIAGGFEGNHPVILATQIAILRQVFSNIKAIASDASKRAAELGYTYDPRATNLGVRALPTLAEPRPRAAEILAEHIRRSIEGTMTHPEQYRAEIDAIVADRSQSLAESFSGFEAESSADVKIASAYGDWWQKASAPYRALLSRAQRTDITNIGVQLAVDFPMMSQAEHDKEGTYYSSNGKELYEFFKSIRKTSGVDPMGDLEILALSAIAESDQRITPRDLRRLALFSLSIAGGSPSFYENVPKLLKDFPKLKKMFEERSAVFLTSERYEGAAKPVFERLMKLRIIDAARAKKNCSKALEAKEEDDAA